MSKPILVLGEAGQVAQEIRKVATLDGRPVVFAGRHVQDLIQNPDPNRLLDRFEPVAVINAAAYSAVDRAELEAAEAMRLNGEAPGLFAAACAERGLPFVHFSSDYVFDGTKGAPYVETDPRSPLNYYGRTKAVGEDGVMAHGDRWSILRTSWLFSAFGWNFVKTMLRLAQTQDEIPVVADQFGTPTWAEDCARVALKMVDGLLAGRTDLIGVTHLSGGGEASWADLAEATFELLGDAGPLARVRRIATEDYPVAAKRPKDSRLDNRKLARLLDWEEPHWRVGLDRCLAELEAAPLPSR